MTWDHLHAYDMFTYKLNMQKFAPGFKERKSSNKRKQIFYLFCALKKLSNEMFFALIRSTPLREMTSCEPVNNNLVRHFDARKLLLSSPTQ